MENYISIKDLLAEFIRKAWLIILCTVICAATLTGIKYVKDVNYQKNVSINGEKGETNFSLTDYEEDLVLNHISQKNCYYEQEQYMEESIYFNLDASNVYVSNIQIYVDAKNQARAYDVVKAYKNYLEKGTVAAKVSEEAEGYRVNDISELVAISINKEEMEQDGDIKQESVTSLVIGITVYEGSESKCSDLSEKVINVLEVFGKEISQKGLAHELILLEKTIFQRNDSEMASNQRKVILDHTTLRRNLTSLEEEMGETLVSIATAELNNETLDGTNETIENISDSKVSISKKYLILGAALGFILSVGVIAVLYIFSGSVKTEEEIRVLFDLRRLGELSVKEKNCFESFADKIFYERDKKGIDVEKEIIASKLINLCELEKITEFAFVGSFEGKAEEQIVDIVKILEKHNIFAKRFTDLNYDAEAFATSSKLGKIVFVETLRKSKTATILNHIKLCKEHSIDILGYVVLDQ